MTSPEPGQTADLPQAKPQVATEPERQPERSSGALQSGKGCWYKIYISECVLCSAGEESRERRWGPPPEDSADRYERTEYACDCHFM